jgi:DNA-binding NarL/FixJ family response regulator
MNDLTDRQREVLAAYARTGTIQGAADACGLSRRGARVHIDAARRKLGVERAVQLPGVALGRGLLTVEEISA